MVYLLAKVLIRFQCLLGRLGVWVNSCWGVEVPRYGQPFPAEVRRILSSRHDTS